MKKIYSFALLLFLCSMATVACGQEKLFEDRFEGTVKPGWTWVRGNPANVRFGKGLEIRCEPHGENEASNVLCRKADFLTHGTVCIETSVGCATLPTRQYQQSGIFWRRAGVVVFKLVYEYVDGRTYIFPGKIPIDSSSVKLRMTVGSGGDLDAEFCPGNESSFRLAYEGRLEAKSDDEVCLQCSGAPDSGEHWVSFQYFTVSKSDD